METPQISASNYSSASLPMNQMVAAQNAQRAAWQANAYFDQFKQAAQLKPPIANKEIAIMAATRRIVQVFIADTNDNIPLDKCLIYSGEQRLTDLTDQELFFEVDIKTLLDKHNETRKGTVDKAVKERTEYLEPARIRDLKMTVVTIAQF